MIDWGLVLESTKETILITFISTFLAYLVGLPLGVILNATSSKGVHPNRIVNTVLSIIVNVLRSIPCLIIVVLAMPITRAIFDRATGKWYTMIIPLFLTSFAYVARVVEQSLSEVDSGKFEAIRSLGASNSQLIFKVAIPESAPSLIVGLSVTMVSILGYTSFAYNIGAGGLISQIWTYYTRNTGNYASEWMFWIMIIFVVLIVQIVQELGLFISRKIDKRRKLR
ncbi:MAG: ABC transporter permease [Erysipelotrichaceae bacterium]|nr:ABC transporter permease [Erysipelotrichaceae bacterium]